MLNRSNPSCSVRFDVEHLFSGCFFDQGMFPIGAIDQRLGATPLNQTR